MIRPPARATAAAAVAAAFLVVVPAGTAAADTPWTTQDHTPVVVAAADQGPSLADRGAETRVRSVTSPPTTPRARTQPPARTRVTGPTRPRTTQPRTARPSTPSPRTVRVRWGTRTCSVTTDGRSYLVQRGDVLGFVAACFGTTVDEITRDNHLLDPDVIRAGQTLLIRRGGSR